MEKELINKKTTKKQWKKFLKTEEFVDHFAFYRAIQMSAKSMIAQMIDFLFMDEIYIAFLELLELNNNIDIKNSFIISFQNKIIVNRIIN